MLPSTLLILCFGLIGCANVTSDNTIPTPIDSVISVDTVIKISAAIKVDTGVNKSIPIYDSLSNNIIAFAKTLIGKPYKFASASIVDGFDCSGFITYVFNHFKIDVPRSSVDFTNVGKTINIKNARPGDLILFTGTDSTKKVVGHMGIITENKETLQFIHSTSGKANGVTITLLNNYYKGRFVKIIRII
jgi:cell wall-associated NlpC family hydrolase